MPFFSKVFRSKDTAAKRQAKENGYREVAPPKPRWDDAWQRQEVEPEEVQELLRGCTVEIRSRGLDLPFLLLPFRPASDPSAARTFVRNYFGNGLETNKNLQGGSLSQELRLVEPLVLCSVLKWCWSRLSGGVVTWEAYELFKIGEQDSSSARDAFATFIPISVASDARTKIIFDFFELLAAIAAHGKTNGLSGLKLSRYAGWWAFEHSDSGKGFDQGYRTWESAANATSHLFLAYLRSLSPDSVKGKNGISALPRSLQYLLETTEYPPSPFSQRRTSKVVMIVETVSPTPFALLRRAKNFEYRDDDAVLQRFSDYDDPVKALTDECRRVLKSISSTNDSSTSKASTSIKDPSWSRFEDIGFGGLGDDSEDEGLNVSSLGATRPQPPTFGASRSNNHGGRPTTPSWADFLSSGFVDDGKAGGPTLLLPPDKVLPPINTRGQSSQSHRRMTDDESTLEPGELANITVFNLDETFWWVWITSLAGEETSQRKAAFGRCALIETRINNGTWLVVEEIIKGAAPEPDANAYVAEKKSRFGFSKRGKLSRSKSSAKGSLAKSETASRVNMTQQPSKTSIAPDQHARIQAAAAALQQKHLREEEDNSPRRARKGDDAAIKTTSVLTLQPVIMSEAAPAMKWASSYDKSTIRAKYLGDGFAGRGSATDLLSANSSAQQEATPKGSIAPPTPTKDEPSMSRKPLSPFAPEQNRLAQASMQPLPPTPKDERKILENASSVPPVTPPIRSGSKPTVNQPEVYPRPMERQEGPPQPPPKENIPPIPIKDVPHHDTTTNGASIEQPPSPENTKPDRNKLKKKAAPNTFKGLFNRKKVEDSEKPATKPAYTSAGSSSAVAAARAALEAKAAQSTGSPPLPQSKVTNKRFSTNGRGGPVEEQAPAQESAKQAPSTIAVPIAQDRPISTTDTNDYTEYASTVDPTDARQAEREFRTFDQGPLQDNPAFVPEDSPRASEDKGDNGLSFVPVNEDARYGEEQEPASVPRDDASEASMEPVTEAISTDRWAQIRKNAAERAARMSEEQSRQTDRTDDGDTSGEETIESRVARIKQRVAELTGNMDTENASRARP